MTEEKKVEEKKIPARKKKKEDEKTEKPAEVKSAEVKETPAEVKPVVVKSASSVEKTAEKVEEKAEKAPKKKKKAAKKSTRAFVARGKRKLSIARATIQAGKGVVRVNKQNISALQNSYVRQIILEPIRYLGPEATEIDVSVNVIGGGMMGQAQAARTAIANALVQYFDQANLK
ncbi:30S ribosomal protein S9, partial [Candidatus Micrarchaeota archaeon]|nr:30S ribosomal protein S9 [Candidatus Micrarchaeota archaeon]